MNIKNYFKHFWTICRHKYYVFLACRDCGITWRGIKHDMSKLNPVEFIEYASNYVAGKSPVDVAKEKYGYSKAWMHHKGRNTHHWTHWIDYEPVSGEIMVHKMPYWDVIELICDWKAAGQAYNKDPWTNADPKKYWDRHKDKFKMHPDTWKLVDLLVTDIEQHGWKMVAFLIWVGAEYRDTYNNREEIHNAETNH